MSDKVNNALEKLASHTVSATDFGGPRGPQCPTPKSGSHHRCLTRVLDTPLTCLQTDCQEYSLGDRMSMRLSSSQCDNLRRVCSGALAETSGAVVQSVTDAFGLSAQRCIATTAPVLRYSRVKDPLGTPGDTTGGSASYCSTCFARCWRTTNLLCHNVCTELFMRM